MVRKKNDKTKKKNVGYNIEYLEHFREIKQYFDLKIVSSTFLTISIKLKNVYHFCSPV